MYSFLGQPEGISLLLHYYKQLWLHPDRIMSEAVAPGFPDYFSWYNHFRYRWYHVTYYKHETFFLLKPGWKDLNPNTTTII